MPRQLESLVIVFATLIARVALAAGAPIVITGHQIVPESGLPQAIGVSSYQVFRASRAAPDLTDQKGWTYHHHVDMACWKGRLYVGWNSCEKDEDVWPSRQLFATSTDGVEWSAPADLFPPDISMAQRMYFFHSPSGRMLAVTAFRNTKDIITERMKGAMIVREIRADHSLGDVFMLKPPASSPPPGTPGEGRGEGPASYRECRDPDFIRACDELLANIPFLEQADYGLCAGDRKMKWHDSATWPADEPSRPHFEKRFGKAMAFYHRRDGALVAVMKWGWVLVSTDEGKTWSSPTRPPTLVAGMAKTWGQRISNDHYALFYNPDLEKRYPLVMVSGDDGVTFGDMRIVQGELPPLRYPGKYKSPGPQYVRGISEWSSDGSRKDDATWIAYSMNKEDIWVSRIPVSPPANAWSTYAPRWTTVKLTREAGEEALAMEDRDPLDYAKVIRPLDPTVTRIRFEMKIDQPLMIELLSKGRPIISRTFAAAEQQAELETRGADAISFQTGPRGQLSSPDQDAPTAAIKYFIRRITFE